MRVQFDMNKILYLVNQLWAFSQLSFRTATSRGKAEQADVAAAHAREDSAAAQVCSKQWAAEAMMTMSAGPITPTSPAAHSAASPAAAQQQQQAGRPASSVAAASAAATAEMAKVATDGTQSWSNRRK